MADLDLAAIPWRTDDSGIIRAVAPGVSAPIGSLETAALAEAACAAHNAELLRRKAAEPSPGSLAEIFTAGVPDGATISGAREEVMLPHTWEKLGADGTEIYLDASQAARFLVRTVTGPPPESCDADVWDGPYRMRCGQTIVNGRCGRHGLRPRLEGTAP